MCSLFLQVTVYSKLFLISSLLVDKTLWLDKMNKKNGSMVVNLETQLSYTRV